MACGISLEERQVHIISLHIRMYSCKHIKCISEKSKATDYKTCSILSLKKAN